jgi:hypothetical protein
VKPSLAILFLLCGCATTPTITEPVAVSRELGPKEKVWPVVVSELTSRYQIKAIEKESGVISTEGKTLSPNDSVKIMHVPAYAQLSGFRGRVSLTVNVGESVSVTAIPEVRQVGRNDEWILCQSRGVVESNFLSSVEQKLKR